MLPEVDKTYRLIRHDALPAIVRVLLVNYHWAVCRVLAGGVKDASGHICTEGDTVDVRCDDFHFKPCDWERIQRDGDD
jgi:hypothetical protein